MKRLAAVCVLMMVLAGCHCPCSEDGVHQGNGVMARDAAMGVYAYSPPEPMAVPIAAVSLAQPIASDGIVTGDGVAAGDDAQQTPFDNTYDELMSVMELEDIGTRSTYRIIR